MKSENPRLALLIERPGQGIFNYPFLSAKTVRHLNLLVEQGR